MTTLSNDSDRTGSRRDRTGEPVADVPALESYDRGPVRARATMRDVAALAGVSIKTVSRVINAESGVSADLIAKVERASSQLEYRPDLTASSLRRSDGKSATIGLLLDDVANPFSSAIHRAVEETARNRGTAVFGASLDGDYEREQSLVSAFLSRRVDGLIVVPTSVDQGHLVSASRSGTVIVFVDRPATNGAYDSVVSDNFGGAYLGTRHLIEKGHRRIAFIGDKTTLSTAAERFSGFCAAMAETGIAVDFELVRQGVDSIDAADSAVEELVSREDPPTAIFSAQNLITIGTVRALRHLHVEREIAVVGFDDFPLADVLDPPVTVVAQDPQALGSLAAELMFARLDGQSLPAKTHVIPTHLIVRGSGELEPHHL